MKSRNARSSIDLDQIRIQRMIVWVQQQRGIGFTPRVRLPDALQVHVHHRIAVEDYETLRQFLKSGENGARRAKRLLLNHVTNLQAPSAAIPKLGLDQLRLKMNERDNVIESIEPCQLDLVLQQWLASDW